MNYIGKTLDELYRIFDIVNAERFNGELPQPMITIQKGRGSVLGHFTLGKCWRDKNNVVDGNDSIVDTDVTALYEINIDPRWFYKKTVIDIVGVLIHEMVHYQNKLRDIKDCSGKIHNKKFKRAAEEAGLIVTKGDTVGWGYTAVSDELRDFIEQKVKPDETCFFYFRAGESVDDGEKKKRQKNFFKFTCPSCGQEIKGRRDSKVRCGLCDVLMEIQDDEENDD